MFVLDASAALGLVFDDEEDQVAEEAFRTGRQAVVPSLFLQEVANAVTVAVRRGRIAREEAAEVLARLTRLPIQVSPAVLHGQVLLEIAIAHDLSAYDATYLALALAEELPLVTTDRTLAAAADAVGLPGLGALIEPASRGRSLPKPVPAASGRSSEEILRELRGDW